MGFDMNYNVDTERGVVKTRFVKGFSKKYIVSNTGVIFSLPRKGNWAGRFLKENVNHKGYARVTLKDGNNVKTLSLHRVVLDAFTDNDCTKDQVNHKNGNKLDNNLSNLEWCTAQYNVAHAYANGLSVAAKGIKKSKLSEKDVLDIVSRYKCGEKLRDIAVDYPVSETALSSIVTGRSWSHVTRLKLLNVGKGYKAC